MIVVIVIRRPLLVMGSPGCGSRFPCFFVTKKRARLWPGKRRRTNWTSGVRALALPLAPPRPLPRHPDPHFASS